MAKKILVWSLVAIIIIATGVAAWFILPKKPKPVETKTPEIQPIVEMTAEEAQKIIDEKTQVVLKSPENVDAALALADAYCATNQLDKVKEAIQRAATLVPTDTRIYDKMISIYMNNNMVIDALLFVDNITDYEVKRQYENKLREQNFPGYSNSGNLMNEGRVATDGAKLYYSEPIDGDSLYSADMDGKNKVKLYQGKVRYINVVGDYVYFSDLSRSYNIFRVKKDGTEAAAIVDTMATELNIVGDRMFYINWTDNCKIYSSKIDGTEPKAINAAMSMNLNLCGAWIYYVNQDDESTVHRVRIDGTNDGRINDVNSLFLNGCGEWVYYINWADNGKIYRSSNDGSGFMEKLNEQRSGYLNITNDTIYYANWVQNGKLSSMSLDGSNQKILSNDRCESIHVFGDWVYYFNQDDAKRLYRCSANGGNRELVGY